jgi:hypothetical protein
MATESWAIDGVSLTSGNFVLLELTADPPKERQDWVSAADSESAALFRQPKHENRTVTMKIRVTPQASMNAALDQVGAVVDKLRKASSTTTGVPLVWTPANASRSATFTVLTGEITGLPISMDGDGYSWILQRPIVNLELTCQPYWYGTETLTSTASTSTPFVTLEVASVTGDAPALGRLIVTDTATQSRRHVEWGLEGPLTYNNATSLLVDSDDMVTSGFSGAGAVTTGAYDPNSAGNNSISMTPIAGATTALAGTGNLSHVGVFRVKARVKSGSLSNQFRLSWRSADGPLNRNAWVYPVSTAGWVEVDLGMITVPAAVLGTQRWTGQIDVKAAATSPGTVVVDYLILVPAADGYGKARAGSPSTAGASLSAYDDFSDTAALSAKAADLGGSWSSIGVATDFSSGSNRLARSTNGTEATPRIGLLGTTLTDQLIEMPFLVQNDNSQTSLVARGIDANNYLRFETSRSGSSSPVIDYARLVKVVAGVETELARVTIGLNLANRGMSLLVYASGVAVGTFTQNGTPLYVVTASDSALAAAGALASGKGGVADRAVGAVFSAARTFWPISISVPSTEPIVVYSGRSLQVRYDVTQRQDATGTYYGDPPGGYRGSRFVVPPGTSRVLVKARRNDIESALDDQVTDATQIQVGWTPRGLAVPR